MTAPQTEKARLIANIKRIEQMTRAEEVRDFKAKVLSSKATERVKHFLLKACDTQADIIHAKADCMAVEGDMNDIIKGEV